MGQNHTLRITIGFCIGMAAAIWKMSGESSLDVGLIPMRKEGSMDRAGSGLTLRKKAGARRHWAVWWP